MNPSTLLKYKTIWKKFKSFRRTVTGKTHIDMIRLFIAAQRKRYAHSASYLRSQVSAIAWFLENQGITGMSTDSSLNRQLKAYESAQPYSKACRKAITIGKLKRLLKSIPILLGNKTYQQRLYSAVFTLMYFGALRIGEAVISQHAKHTIMASQLQIAHKMGKIKLQLNSFKHSKPKPLPPLIFVRDKEPLLMHVFKYAERRKNAMTPSSPAGVGDGDFFFLEEDGSPLHRCKVVSVLKKCLLLCKLKPEDFNSHSFRIGRATDWRKEGFTDGQIAAMGRWSSDAFQKYFKPTSINMTKKARRDVR